MSENSINNKESDPSSSQKGDRELLNPFTEETKTEPIFEMAE